MPHFFRKSRISIIACILENSNESSRRKRLASECNLNLSQFNQYKEFLVESGLLEASAREDGIKAFETTEKGKEFLRDYSSIKTILR